MKRIGTDISIFEVKEKKEAEEHICVRAASGTSGTCGQLEGAPFHPRACSPSKSLAVPCKSQLEELMQAGFQPLAVPSTNIMCSA